jgi:GAF domain-containing protein
MPDSLVRPRQGADPRLERLIYATSALITELSLDGVLQRVVQVAAEVIGGHYAAIGVLAPDGRVLESFTTHGISDEVRARIGPPPRGHGILGLVIRDPPHPIRLPDLTKHPDSYGFPPHHPPMHSFLGVPIVGRRGVFGNLYLTEKIDAEAFSEDDEHMAVVLATITGAAVENARLHEESARLLEEVQGLHRTRERFFAMVNHELRNALAAVFGWSEMLVRKKDPATVPRAAFEVLDSAKQAIGLINDLLDLSRLDEDRLKPVIRSPPGCRAARPTPAGWSRSSSTSWATPFTTRPTRPRSGSRSPPASAWSSTWWRTKGRVFQRARPSGSSTSTSPRPPARAGGPGSACPSPAAWPGSWGASSGRCPGRAPAGGSCWSSPPRRIHEERFTKSYGWVQTSRIDCGP